MTLKEFENLVRIGQLRVEPPDSREFRGLLTSCLEQSRIFTLCHNHRNQAEYEGFLNVDEQLLSKLIAGADDLLALVETLSP